MSLDMSNIHIMARVNILLAINNAIICELFHSDVNFSDDEREALKNLYIDNLNELHSLGI